MESTNTVELYKLHLIQLNYVIDLSMIDILIYTWSYISYRYIDFITNYSPYNH